MPKYTREPEFVSNLRIVDSEGNERFIGDNVASVAVYKGDAKSSAIVQFDIREYPRKKDNLVIEIPLSDLIAAISSATLNAEEK
jgi:hypothetical protein